MNNVTSITASAVPAVPRTITATQRLAALNLARLIEEFKAHCKASGGIFDPFTEKLLDDSFNLLNELAGDAKGER